MMSKAFSGESMFQNIYTAREAGFFGGEGLFNTVLTGPGKIWLQTMPISSVAASIAGITPSGN